MKGIISRLIPILSVIRKPFEKSPATAVLVPVVVPVARVLNCAVGIPAIGPPRPSGMSQERVVLPVGLSWYVVSIVMGFITIVLVGRKRTGIACLKGQTSA